MSERFRPTRSEVQLRIPSHGEHGGSLRDTLSSPALQEQVMVRSALWCAVVAACVAGGAYAQQATQTPPPTPPQQPQQPVFRAGVNFVQVDAYPTGPDGKIIEGLSAGDF